MTPQEANTIARLAKMAAYHGRPQLTPPRTTSHSRTFKVKKDKKKSDKEMKRKTGNAQPPHRYGRKIK